MKKTAIYIVWMLALAVTGCKKTVLEFPEGEGVDPTRIQTRLELKADFTPISAPLIATYGDGESGDFDVRYQVEVYAKSGANAGERVFRTTWTDKVINDGETTIPVDIELRAEAYDVYAWIDFVPSGTEADYHYLTADLRKVSIADPNVAGYDSRDAFAGKATAELKGKLSQQQPLLPVPLMLHSKILQSMQPLPAESEPLRWQQRKSM